MELEDLLKDLDAKSDCPAKEYLYIEVESDLYPNMNDGGILNSVQNNVEDDEDLNQACQTHLGLRAKFFKKCIANPFVGHMYLVLLKFQF